MSRKETDERALFADFKWFHQLKVAGRDQFVTRLKRGVVTISGHKICASMTSVPGSGLSSAIFKDDRLTSAR